MGSRTGNNGTDMVREGLQELYARHHGFVWRVCWRYVQNSADADDLAHDVLVKAARGWTRFAGDCAATSWLYRIASNHCCDHLRKRRLQQDAQERSMFPPCAGAWSSRAAEAEAEAACLADTAASEVLNVLRHVLQGTERHIVYLRFDVGLPQHGIARITGLPRAAVRRRLARIVGHAAGLLHGLEEGAPRPHGNGLQTRFRS